MRTPHEIRLKLILISVLLTLTLSGIDTRAQGLCQMPAVSDDTRTARTSTGVCSEAQEAAVESNGLSFL